jgi:hypothetical protein
MVWGEGMRVVCGCRCWLAGSFDGDVVLFVLFGGEEHLVIISEEDGGLECSVSIVAVFWASDSNGMLVDNIIFAITVIRVLFALFDRSVLLFALSNGKEYFVAISKEGEVLGCSVTIAVTTSTHGNGGLFDLGVIVS